MTDLPQGLPARAAALDMLQAALARRAGLDDALAEKVYDIEMQTFSKDGHFDPAGLEAVKQALLDLGQVKEKPDNATILTEEFLP
jgi:hypothetical protein